MSDLQPWTVAVIAGLGLLIAYFQWRTAHQRIVLDLFDRRLRVFETAAEACGSIISSGKASMEALRKLHQAKSNARFLFRDDVNSYLKDRIADCAFLLSHDDEVINSREGDARDKLIDRKYSALTKISEYQNEAPPIFAPYMRLHQKMQNPWLPW